MRSPLGSGSPSLSALDDQTRLTCSNRHLLAIGDLPGQDHLRQGVLQRALDYPLQRPRPVDRVIAGVRKPFLGRFVELQRDAPLLQQALQVAQLDIDDGGQVIATESMRSEEHTSEL